MSSAFRSALRLHQSGQTAKAQALYREILRHDPKHFDACHLLGTTLVQQGAVHEGIALISQALAIRPGHADAHFNLATAWQSLGDSKAALACLDRALALAPGDAQYHLEKGTILEVAGQLEAALTCYDGALSLAPHDPGAQIRRSSVLIKLGRLEEAGRSCDAALRASLREPGLLVALGNCLMRLRRMDDAVSTYERAIAIAPASAEAHLEKGRALFERGQYREAGACFNKAIGLKPGFARPYYFRALLLERLQRFEDALASIGKAAELRPGHANTHNVRGDILRNLGRLAEARMSYDEALRLKPDHAAAHYGLARIASDTGRFSEALENYEKLRRLDPDAILALCGIAEVKKFEADDPLFQEFEARIARNDFNADEGARLHHAYGKICNDAGRYDDAFHHFSIGKSLLPVDFDMERHAAGYEAMKALFTKDFLAARRNWGLADERPVFVVGMPRSGTTLTEQIVASHPRAEGLGELKDLPNIIAERCGPFEKTGHFGRAVSSLTAADVAKMAERYCAAYAGARPGSVRLVDKRPHNYEWLGFIALMFPKAHIIHCRRNALDNCVSMYVQNFTESHGYNRDLQTLGRYYRAYEGLMEHWAAVLPRPVHEFVYETVIGDFEASVQALVSFLGLEWDDRCLAYHQQDRRVSTPSRWQVRQPIYDRSVGRWRCFERHLGPLRAALGVDQAS